MILPGFELGIRTWDFGGEWDLVVRHSYKVDRESNCYLESSCQRADPVDQAFFFDDLHEFVR